MNNYLKQIFKGFFICAFFFPVLLWAENSITEDVDDYFQVKTIFYTELLENTEPLFSADVSIYYEREKEELIEFIPEEIKSLYKKFMASGGVVLLPGQSGRHFKWFKGNSSPETVNIKRLTNFEASVDLPQVTRKSFGEGALFQIGLNDSRSLEYLKPNEYPDNFLKRLIEYSCPQKVYPKILLVVDSYPEKEFASDVRPVEHSLLTKDPSKPMIDLWGWHTTPFYQRPEVVSPDYLKQNAVLESFKAGANLIEIYRGGYPFEKRAGWTKESTAEFHRFVHDHDMVIQWFPHRIAGRNFEYTIERTEIFVKENFDCLAEPLDVLPDGFGSENWTTITPELFNMCCGSYMPAHYFYTSKHRYSQTMPNEQDVTDSGGYGVDDQTSDFISQYNLYKAYFQLRPSIQKRFGHQYYASQAECRDGTTTNRFGGSGLPDWILKQANDLCRIRARGDEHFASPSAIWWINEVRETCSTQNRAYVYGISQDPVKCAVTHKFNALGKDNYSSKARRLAQRFPYSADWAFIQNNYFQIIHADNSDKCLLRYDPERLAHYDGNSESRTLSDYFLRTLQGEKNLILADDVKFSHIEPAGYKAVLDAELNYKSNSDDFRENRRFIFYSDTSFFKVKIRRSFKKIQNAADIITEIPLKAYEQLTLDNQQYYRSKIFKPHGHIKLIDIDGKYPALIFSIYDNNGIKSISFEPGKGLKLHWTRQLKHSCEIGVVIPDGLYNKSSYDKLVKFIKNPETTVELDKQGRYDFTNNFDIPIVKILKVKNSPDKPYFIKEFGRWSFRGAQSSVEFPECDYVKCYMKPNETISLQQYEYIKGILRPGWGCQYTTSIVNCGSKNNISYADVEVKSVTSFLFAPRLRFKMNLKNATINGRPWNYFDKNILFLPNSKGRYHVEVVHGKAESPGLVRSMAPVDKAEYTKQNLLEIETRLPHWVTDTPEGFQFYALISHHGKNIQSVSGAQLVRQAHKKASVIRFLPGIIKVRFTESTENIPDCKFNAASETAMYLCKKSAKETVPYLSQINYQMFSLKELSENPELLRDYNVILWNQYYIDRLPDHCSTAETDLLTNAVNEGKNLFLVANACHVLPEIFDLSDMQMTTEVATYGALNKFRSKGICISEDLQESDIYKDLEFDKHNNLTAVLVETDRWDALKRIMIPEESSLFREAEKKGSFYISGAHPNLDKKVIAKSPVLFEWKHGKGVIVAYTTNLRRGMGSMDLMPPTENEYIFIENIIRYLSATKKDCSVAVIW